MPVKCCQLADGDLKAKFTGKGVREKTKKINQITLDCYGSLDV
uniref:Uncharacterized protein n=1 Tax=Klebsiella pneumoniae TaxID=573 RepID=A0A482E5X9_KLEPN|nr:hypothetical protein [Klebsiella pneumoniae]